MASLSEKQQEEVEGYIEQKTGWDTLPVHAQQYFNASREAYHQHVVLFSVHHQVRWRTGLVKSMVSDEKAYYNEIIKFSSTHLMVNSKLSLLFTLKSELIL